MQVKLHSIELSLEGNPSADGIFFPLDWRTERTCDIDYAASSDGEGLTHVIVLPPSLGGHCEADVFDGTFQKSLDIN